MLLIGSAVDDYMYTRSVSGHPAAAAAHGPCFVQPDKKPAVTFVGNKMAAVLKIP